MAKLKPQERSRSSKRAQKKSKKSNGAGEKSQTTPESLLSQALVHLQTSQADEALILARRALAILRPGAQPTKSALPAINLMGEINIEIGDIDAARQCFMEAAALDPSGDVPESVGGGSEKFLWLAQLNEEGGAQSVQWFEKGAIVLRKEISQLEKMEMGPIERSSLLEKRAKLASALCGIAEVYMTDLSWEDEAESRCEALVTEAVMVAPESPEPLQTLASVRISQLKQEEARIALKRSMQLWKDLEPEDARVPDFPSRISLSRLLMESDLEEDAIEILERLTTEDDRSVEAWYLGGWCLHLMSQKADGKIDSLESERIARDKTSLARASREWLKTCLKLYEICDYEDERMRDHALEIVLNIDNCFGTAEEGNAGLESQDDDDWEDEQSEDEDEDMDGS